MKAITSQTKIPDENFTVDILMILEAHMQHPYLTAVSFQKAVTWSVLTRSCVA